MLGGRWLAVYPAGHEKAGQLRGRRFQCEPCKQETGGEEEKIAALEWYVQHIMAKAWLEALPADAQKQIREDNPELLVPQHCPKHERQALQGLILKQNRRPGPYGMATPPGYFSRDGSEGANSDAWLFGAKD